MDADEVGKGTQTMLQVSEKNEEVIEEVRTPKKVIFLPEKTV